MPEGDSIFRAARTLHRALAGSPVTRFESAFPALNRIDHDRPLAGRTIESVSARGKHLLMTFSGDLVLRTHMKMHGSWHIYRPGERWQRPARDMRIVVETARFVAVGFNVPVAEFLTGRELSRHRRARSARTRPAGTVGSIGSGSPFDARGPARIRTGTHGHRRRPAESARRRRHRERVQVRDPVRRRHRSVRGRRRAVRRGAHCASSTRRRRCSERTCWTGRRRCRPRSAGGRHAASIPARSSGSTAARANRAGRAARRSARRKPGVDARLTYWCPGCQESGYSN